MKDYKAIEKKMQLVIDQIQKGGAVLVSDDENRENEGDLIASAETATYETINLMATEGRGLICVPVSTDYARRLELAQMVPFNTDSHGTAFTVSVDAAEGTTTGISIADRVATLRKLAAKESTPSDFKKPGHLFPLTAKEGGLFVRKGHTEAAVELMKIAGLAPAGVICEVLNKDGTMARVKELNHYAKKHKLPFITIEEVIYYLKMQETFIERVADAEMPTDFGTFRMIGYHNRMDDREHFVLLAGDPDNFSAEPSVRLHSECLTGDLLSSRRCDCGSQLHKAMKEIQEKGEGAIVYLRQEGRGIGLFNKLKAYQLQDQGLDTVDANLELGYDSDIRDYAVAAAILRDIGLSKVQLMTNNPLKIEGLRRYGIEVAQRIHHEVDSNSNNRFYLETKKRKMGHLLKKV